MSFPKSNIPGQYRLQCPPSGRSQTIAIEMPGTSFGKEQQSTLLSSTRMLQLLQKEPPAAFWLRSTKRFGKSQRVVRAQSTDAQGTLDCIWSIRYRQSRLTGNLRSGTYTGDSSANIIEFISSKDSRHTLSSRFVYPRLTKTDIKITAKAMGKSKRDM